MFRITIPTRHVAVVYHAGQLVGVLPAGRTRRRWGHRYVLVDLRERQQVIPPQDIPTADGLGVRVSAVARWAITDPIAFLEVSQVPTDTLHLATQLALRESVGALAAADLVVTGCSELSALDRGGPVVSAVTGWAADAQLPCVLFTTGAGLARRELRTLGLEAAHLLASATPSEADLTAAAARIATGWVST